jgi:hypothetical protein
MSDNKEDNWNGYEILLVICAIIFILLQVSYPFRRQHAIEKNPPSFKINVAPTKN